MDVDVMFLRGVTELCGVVFFLLIAKFTSWDLTSLVSRLSYKVLLSTLLLLSVLRGVLRAMLSVG